MILDAKQSAKKDVWPYTQHIHSYVVKFATQKKYIKKIRVEPGHDGLIQFDGKLGQPVQLWSKRSD